MTSETQGGQNIHGLTTENTKTNFETCICVKFVTQDYVHKSYTQLEKLITSRFEIGLVDIIPEKTNCGSELSSSIECCALFCYQNLVKKLVEMFYSCILPIVSSFVKFIVRLRRQRSRTLEFS